MKSENLIPFSFNESPITVVLHEGAPWFVANEICEALAYKNTSQAVADHLDNDEKMNVAKCDGQLFGQIMTLSKRYSHSGKRGGAQFLTLINESGLYSLVLRSHKPEAKKFSKWVTREVLPSIRKTGSYNSSPQQLAKDCLKSLKAFVRLDIDGHQSVTLVDVNSVAINPRDEAQVRGFIHELSDKMYPMIADIILEHYKEVARVYGSRRKPNDMPAGTPPLDDYVSVPVLGAANIHC